jgi:hypothetical protein
LCLDNIGNMYVFQLVPMRHVGTNSRLHEFKKLPSEGGFLLTDLPTRGQCYDHNFNRFYLIFARKWCFTPAVFR